MIYLHKNNFIITKCNNTTVFITKKVKCSDKLRTYNQRNFRVYKNNCKHITHSCSKFYFTACIINFYYRKHKISCYNINKDVASRRVFGERILLDQEVINAESIKKSTFKQKIMQCLKFIQY